jgi:hypothetical protein
MGSPRGEDPLRELNNNQHLQNSYTHQQSDDARLTSAIARGTNNPLTSFSWFTTGICLNIGNSDSDIRASRKKPMIPAYVSAFDYLTLSSIPTASEPTNDHPSSYGVTDAIGRYLQQRRDIVLPILFGSEDGICSSAQSQTLDQFSAISDSCGEE